MKSTLFIVVMGLVLYTGTARAMTPVPLTLDEKVQQAELIILGRLTRSAEHPVEDGQMPPIFVHEQSIDIADVLWPSGWHETNRITIPELRVGTNAPSFGRVWNQTNACALFFLTKSNVYAGTFSGAHLATTNGLLKGLLLRGRGSWGGVGSTDFDWMEPCSNTLAVLVSILRHKGEPAPRYNLEILHPDLPLSARSQTNPRILSVFAAMFRDAYFSALDGNTMELPVFAPVTDEEKAKVLAYAEGRQAGRLARERWEREFRQTNQGSTPQQAASPNAAPPHR